MDATTERIWNIILREHDKDNDPTLKQILDRSSSRTLSRSICFNRSRGFDLTIRLNEVNTQSRCRHGVVACLFGHVVKKRCSRSVKNKIFKSTILYGNYCADCIYNGTQGMCSFAKPDTTDDRSHQSTLRTTTKKRETSGYHGLESQIDQRPAKRTCPNIIPTHSRVTEMSSVTASDISPTSLDESHQTVLNHTDAAEKLSILVTDIQKGLISGKGSLSLLQEAIHQQLDNNKHAQTESSVCHEEMKIEINKLMQHMSLLHQLLEGVSTACSVEKHRIIVRQHSFCAIATKQLDRLGYSKELLAHSSRIAAVRRAWQETEVLCDRFFEMAVSK